MAQEVSGQKPKIVTEEQRAALIESARQAGKELAGLRLRPETLATLDAMPPIAAPQRPRLWRRQALKVTTRSSSAFKGH